MSEIYKIGVAIMLTDGLTPALSMLSHKLLGVHRSVTAINSGLGGWRTALVGAAGVLGGTMILGGLAKVAAHGEKILDQQDKLIRAGRTQAEVANITAEAYNKITKAVPTATAADVLRVANELTFVKGDFGKAQAAASGALKLEALIGNATGKNAEGQGYSIWRALEEKLVTQDEPHTDKLMDLMAKGIIGSGGKITGSDYFTFARRAGMSYIKSDDAFVAGVMPTLINMLKADTAGTSYQTAWMSLMGTGTLSKQQMEGFSRLGLIDPTKAHNDHGHWNLESGAIKGSIEHQGNLFDWARLVLKPALEKFPEEQRASILARSVATATLFGCGKRSLATPAFNRFKKTLHLSSNHTG